MQNQIENPTGLFARVSRPEVRAEIVRRLSGPRRCDAIPFVALPDDWTPFLHCKNTSILKFWSMALAGKYWVFHNLLNVSILSVKPNYKALSKERNTLTRESRKRYWDKQRLDGRRLQQLRNMAAASWQRNKEKVYAYRKERRKRDPNYHISGNLRTYIYQRVGMKNDTGQSRFREVVGCTIDEFRKHLEAHWQPGMNWENYGKLDGKWSIDHTRPCSRFDLTDPEQVRACFHFSNMKPMWWRDNLMKSDKIATD